MVNVKIRNSFSRQILSLIRNPKNIAGYFYFVVHLTTFLSVFFLLYKAYQQDIKRSEVLSKDASGLLQLEDRERVRKDEGERIFKFSPDLLFLVVFPSLILSLFKGGLMPEFISGNPRYRGGPPFNPPRFLADRELGFW